MKAILLNPLGGEPQTVRCKPLTRNDLVEVFVLGRPVPRQRFVKALHEAQKVMPAQPFPPVPHERSAECEAREVRHVR